MNADGSQQVLLGETDESLQIAASGSAFDPLPSPDGQYLVLNDEGLWLTDRLMKKLQRLVHPVSQTSGFSWSPDGQFLAIAVGAVSIFSMETRTKRSSDIYSVTDIPRWSPDGKYIAFVGFYVPSRNARESGSESRYQVYILDVSSMETCLLTASGNYSDFDPKWLTS